MFRTIIDLAVQRGSQIWPLRIILILLMKLYPTGIKDLKHFWSILEKSGIFRMEKQDKPYQGPVRD